MCERRTRWLANADQHLERLISKNVDQALEGLREVQADCGGDAVATYNVTFDRYRDASAEHLDPLDPLIGLLTGALMRLEREQRRHGVTQ